MTQGWLLRRKLNGTTTWQSPNWKPRFATVESVAILGFLVFPFLADQIFYRCYVFVCGPLYYCVFIYISSDSDLNQPCDRCRVKQTTKTTALHFISSIICKYAIQPSGCNVLVIKLSIYLSVISLIFHTCIFRWLKTNSNILSQYLRC